jgi:hypothetical protein
MLDHHLGAGADAVQQRRKFAGSFSIRDMDHAVSHLAIITPTTRDPARLASFPGSLGPGQLEITAVKELHIAASTVNP